MKKIALFLIVIIPLITTSIYPQSFNFERIDPEYVYLNPDTNFAKSHFRITNNLGVPDQIRILRVTINLPAGIANGICDLNSCYGVAVDTATANYPSGISQTDLYIYFTDSTFNASGQG